MQPHLSPFSLEALLPSAGELLGASLLGLRAALQVQSVIQGAEVGLGIPPHPCLTPGLLGSQVALDMLQYENVAVRRVLSSEEELVKKFGVTSFPSGYLLLRNGSFTRLPV